MIADRTVAVAAFVISGYTVSWFDHTGAQPRPKHTPMTAMELEYQRRDESVSRGDAMLMMLFLGAVHLALLLLFTRRWAAVGLFRRLVASAVAGAGGYLLLLGAILCFRPIYADPLQSIYLFAVLLALPTVGMTVLTAEGLRWRMCGIAALADE
ncbi:MAG: hypothetical protein V4558_15910 [Gemmatimonadota bacterium]